jgi:hypothetical protein
LEESNFPATIQTNIEDQKNQQYWTNQQMHNMILQPVYPMVMPPIIQLESQDQHQNLVEHQPPKRNSTSNSKNESKLRLFRFSAIQSTIAFTFVRIILFILFIYFILFFIIFFFFFFFFFK